MILHAVIHPEKSFFDSNNIFLNQKNLYIAIRPKKSLFDLKKFLDYFFSLNLKNECLRGRISI